MARSGDRPQRAAELARVVGGHGDGGIGEAVDRRAATASCFCGILSRMRAFVFCVAPVYDAGQVEMYLLNSAGLYLLWPVS